MKEVGKYPDYALELGKKQHDDNLLRYREIYRRMYVDTSRSNLDKPLMTDPEVKSTEPAQR